MCTASCKASSGMYLAVLWRTEGLRVHVAGRRESMADDADHDHGQVMTACDRALINELDGSSIFRFRTI